MENIVYVTDKDILKAHDAKWGNYNTAPAGLREISEKEFAASSFFIWIPLWTDTRQIRDWNGEPFLSIRLFWFNNETGIGISHAKQEKVRYFKFGCAHKYRELGAEEARTKGHPILGRCYHVEECTLCHHIMEIDSSD